MCVILDASMYGDFLKDDEHMKPVKDWIKKGGTIVFSETYKMQEELHKSSGMYELFREYRRRDILTRVDKSAVEKKQRQLVASKRLKSDDPHIIALASVANVKLLISKDKALHQDFKNVIGGSIYQYKEQEHLLRKNPCRHSR